MLGGACKQPRCVASRRTPKFGPVRPHKLFEGAGNITILGYLLLRLHVLQEPVVVLFGVGEHGICGIEHDQIV